MSSMMSPFGGPTGTFAQQSQNTSMNAPANGFGGVAPTPPQNGFGGQQQGGFGGQQGGLGGMFGGFGGQQGGFGMPQMQSPYGPQQGGFGGGMGGGFGGGFNPYQQQMQSPYGPQMGGFGGYGGQQGGFGGYGQQMGGFGGMGGGFNPYQQGMMGGFGGGMGGGFNPYQMQSPYGPQMGGFGGGFGGGMGGFGRGMGRGKDRMVGNQGMGGYGGGFDDMSHALPPNYRGGNMRDNPQESRGNMSELMQTMDMPQYSAEDQMMQRGQMGRLGGSPEYQNMAMPAVMPQQDYGRNSQQVNSLQSMLRGMGSYDPNSAGFRTSQARQAALQAATNYNPMMD